MSNNKPITVAEAARLFGFVAAAMVIVFLAISMEGEPPPVRPAWTLSEGLQRVLWLLGLSVVAVVGLVAFLGLVARHSARTQDTSREGNALQAINAALIDERNQWERKAVELAQERDALKEELWPLKVENKVLSKRMIAAEMDLADALKDIETLIAKLEEASGVIADATNQIENMRTQIPLGILHAAAIIEAIADDLAAGRAPALRRLIPFLRELGIPVTKAGYETLSAAVHRLRAPSPTERAQPVRDAATERKPANARRERARTRSRTHPRTRKQ